MLELVIQIFLMKKLKSDLTKNISISEKDADAKRKRK